ncbi:hypothetical protein PTTG_25122 [Puccinia triticina 1-1 BBBD Race 1]|uniref:Uncharacterized protein n=1 Tax=Puccinia triticina (isolate 1-1 / race 1 (BBBD)) TaxID=630390 RepID=A0A180H4P5_PUCT1|nr:hypothetical protein PTTG_25122 [Puccinia triticina 1-1 BBBD Race 1]
MVRHSRARIEHKVDESIFYQRPGKQGDKWFCHLCSGGGQGSKKANLRKHKKTPAHLAALRNRDQPNLQSGPSTPLPQTDNMIWITAHNQSPNGAESVSTSASDHLHKDLAFIDEDSAFGGYVSDKDSNYSLPSSHSGESVGWDGLIPGNHPEIPCELPVANNLQGQDNAGNSQSHTQSWDWWPFKSKEYMIGSMIIGHTRTIISRLLYNHIRMMFNLAGTELPYWPPICLWHTEFTNGCHIFKLSQSAKWLKELGPDTRAQMARHMGHDYYLHELVQLQSDLIVVPQFFYEFEGELYACCVTPTIDINEERGGLKFIIPKDLSFTAPQIKSIKVANFYVKYPLMESPDGTLISTLCDNRIYEIKECNDTRVRTMPNPWRAKAGNRVIQHLPISLYSNDTSGNLSKKWNKHISYYFNLAGLPPKLTNQHFHCHFLCTSNSAGTLELAEGIVDDIMELIEHGCPAYDSGLGKEVLVITSLLCFLADTPMHSEITSTVMPNNARNPCRVCDLGVTRAAQKRSMAYLQFFLQVSANGVWIKNGIRSWVLIIANCYQLWEVSKRLRTKTLVTKLGGELGIKDSINKQIYLHVYDIQAKGANATAANRLFTERIENLDETNQLRLFNSFF